MFSTSRNAALWTLISSLLFRNMMHCYTQLCQFLMWTKSLCNMFAICRRQLFTGCRRPFEIYKLLKVESSLHEIDINDIGENRFPLMPDLYCWKQNCYSPSWSGTQQNIEVIRLEGRYSEVKQCLLSSGKLIEILPEAVTTLFPCLLPQWMLL